MNNRRGAGTGNSSNDSSPVSYVSRLRRERSVLPGVIGTMIICFLVESSYKALNPPSPTPSSMATVTSTSSIDDALASMAAPALVVTTTSADTMPIPPLSPQSSVAISSPVFDQKDDIPADRELTEDNLARNNPKTAKEGNGPKINVRKYVEQKKREKAKLRRDQKQMSPTPQNPKHQQQYSPSRPLEEGWTEPPSQRNFGKSNPSGRSKPALKPQAEGFLRARAKTWEKGTPQLTGPYPDEYVPHLTAAKRPLKTRTAYSLPTRLWDQPAHDPGRDAILALAVNYRIIDYVRFVGTLRRTGYTGDIVLAVAQNMDDRCRRFLMAMDVIACEFYVANIVPS